MGCTSTKENTVLNNKKKGKKDFPTDSPIDNFTYDDEISQIIPIESIPILDRNDFNEFIYVQTGGGK